MGFKIFWMEAQLRGRGIDVSVEGDGLYFNRPKDKKRGMVRNLTRHVFNWNDDDPQWEADLRVLCYCGRVNTDKSERCPVCGRFTTTDPFKRFTFPQPEVEPL